MTDAPETTTPDMEPGSPTAARRWGLAAALTALVVVLIGFAVFAAERADNNDDETTTQQVAAAQRACQQWLDDAPSGDRPRAAWCDRMAGRMTDHMCNGQMTGGSMMSDTPQDMRDWCAQATSESRAGVDDPTRWSDQMVDRMNDRTRDAGD